MAKKYGKKAAKKVERALHERKRGTLRSGGSGKKVTSRKQAIAIGLSEARRAGAKYRRIRTAGKRRNAGRSARGNSEQRSYASDQASMGSYGRRSAACCTANSVPRFAALDTRPLDAAAARVAGGVRRKNFQ